MFPRFRLVQNELSETGEVLGLVTATTYGQETWIDDRWIGYLVADTHLIRGRWNRRDDLWGFVPDKPGALQAPVASSEWMVLDGYWGGRAEIVFDRGRQWQRARFEVADAVRFKQGSSVYMKKADDSHPEGSELVEGGWDHEHCEICLATLGPDGQPEGYVSEGATWVCEHCYAAYVQRRSLEFIPSV
jgi:hypothetical protein